MLLDFVELFHNHCNITHGTLLWVDSGRGVSAEGGWTTSGRLNPPLGVFGLVMSLSSVSHRPKHA